jgi:hypothetical protein
LYFLLELVDELAEDEIRIRSPVQHQRQEQLQQHSFMENQQQQQQSLSMKRPADDLIHRSSSYNDIGSHPDNSYDSAEEEFREFVTTPKKRRKTKKNQKKKSKGSDDGMGDEDDDEEEEEEEGGDGEDDENGGGAVVDDEYEQYLKRADPPDLLAQMYMNSLTPTNNFGNVNSDGFAGPQHNPFEQHNANDYHQNQYHQIPQHQQYQQYPQPQQAQSFLLNDHLRSASATATTAYYPDQRQASQQSVPSYHTPLPLPSLHGFPSFTHQQQLPQQQSHLPSPFTNHNIRHLQQSNPVGYNSATVSSQNPFEQVQSYYGSSGRNGSNPISVMSPSNKTYNENTNQSLPPLLFSSSSSHSSNYPTFTTNNNTSSHARPQNYSFGHTSSLNISSSSSDNQPQLPQVIHPSLLVRIPSRKPTFLTEENQQNNTLVVIDVEEEEKKNNEEEREEDKGRITGEETFRLSERFNNEMGLAPEMKNEETGIHRIVQNSNRFGQESDQNVFITQPRAQSLMFHNNVHQSPYFSSQPISQQAQQIQQHHHQLPANIEEQSNNSGEEEENRDSSSDDTIPISLKRKRQLPSNLQSSSTFHS